MIKAIIFDWGDTVMRDFPEYHGSMAYWPRVELVPEIDAALPELHRDYTICLATNAGDSDAGLAGKALERANIRMHFDHIFTSKELGFTKPDPEFFREILRRIGLKADECVMVGNDLHKDILPAKKVGMQVIWFREKENGDEIPEEITSVQSICQVIEVLSPPNRKRLS